MDHWRGSGGGGGSVFALPVTWRYASSITITVVVLLVTVETAKGMLHRLLMKIDQDNSTVEVEVCLPCQSRDVSPYMHTDHPYFGDTLLVTYWY